jgi:heptosyltransferase-1
MVLRRESSKRDHTRRAETEQGLMQITAYEVTMAALQLLKSERDKVDV